MNYLRSILQSSIAICVLLMPIKAFAGGSISFEDVVTRLAGQSEPLMTEINAELTANSTTISDIVCDGARLGKHWKHLGGLRIPAFECTLGKKRLTIEGDVGFYDAKGKAGAGPMTAMYVALSNPKWSWK